MKRRISEDMGPEGSNPNKMSKDENDKPAALSKADTVVHQGESPEPTRSRQRKAPAWLSSYVTGGSAKELAKAAAEASVKKSPSSASKRKVNCEDSKSSSQKISKKSHAKSPGGSLKPSPSSVSSSSSPVTVGQNKKSKSNTSAASVGDSLGTESVLEVCESIELNTASKKEDPIPTDDKKSNNVPKAGTLKLEDTISMPAPLDGKVEKPTMLEVVICVSTSGAMRDYLTELQAGARELIWKLQSLVPDLRVGVFAHTQGGIHDDKRQQGTSVANMDHNYIRTGGHSGTKWLDLGASFSQICAFISTLEPESSVYPDYVQDNLEMALWKVQRCMSWSSCSYRTVVMLGRGRPNSASFYLQREHWRGWIRSALELPPKQEIPVIDWRLEARFLAQMGIHVFTLQIDSDNAAAAKEGENDEEEEEGTKFYREVAALTNGQHFKLSDPTTVIDIIMGVCCACHGPDLLQEIRDELRDLNDGMVPLKLRDVFVSLGLHSKRRSLQTVPSIVGDLHALQNRIRQDDLAKNGCLFSSSEDEAGFSSEGEDINTSPVTFTKIESKKLTKSSSTAKAKVNGTKIKQLAVNKKKNPETAQKKKPAGTKKDNDKTEAKASKKLAQASPKAKEIKTKKGPGTPVVPKGIAKSKMAQEKAVKNGRVQKKTLKDEAKKRAVSTLKKLKKEQVVEESKKEADQSKEKKTDLEEKKPSTKNSASVEDTIPSSKSTPRAESEASSLLSKKATVGRASRTPASNSSKSISIALKSSQKAATTKPKAAIKGNNSSDGKPKKASRALPPKNSSSGQKQQVPVKNQKTNGSVDSESKGRPAKRKSQTLQDKEAPAKKLAKPTNQKKDAVSKTKTEKGSSKSVVAKNLVNGQLSSGRSRQGKAITAVAKGVKSKTATTSVTRGSMRNRK